MVYIKNKKKTFFKRKVFSHSTDLSTLQITVDDESWKIIIIMIIMVKWYGFDGKNCIPLGYYWFSFIVFLL